MHQAIEDALGAGQPVSREHGLVRAVVLPASHYLILVRPIHGHPTLEAVGIQWPLLPVYRELRQQQKIVFAYLLINLIVLTAIGFFRLYRKVIRPMEHLVDLAETYDGQEVTDFQISGSGNEWRKLSTAMQSMLQRIEADRGKLKETIVSLEAANQQLQTAQREMIRTEKLAAVGRLAAGLAHEIGNPLGIVQGYLGLMGQAGLSEQELKEYRQRAEGELQRITKLVRQLTTLARNPEATEERVSVNALVRDVIELLSPQSLMDNIELQVELDAVTDCVACDPDQLQQVLLNCILNSSDALAEKKSAGVASLYIGTDNYRRGLLRLLIRDNGEGVHAKDLANVFDPFFTTKEPGRGTGLGLSVSYAIIERMGGQMELESTRGEGAIVTIELPLCEDGDE
jgi:signal transduction histidine kinase